MYKQEKYVHCESMYMTLLAKKSLIQLILYDFLAAVCMLRLLDATMNYYWGGVPPFEVGVPHPTSRSFPSEESFIPA